MKQIADAFVDGRLPTGDGIRPVAAKVAKINFENIQDYPDPTGALRASSWETSVCVWVGDCWDVLVDLSTAEGKRSDLVLHAKVYDLGDRVEVEAGLIYVP